MVEGGMKCVKYLLFAFNLVFFLAGLGLIIAGAVVQTRFNNYFAFFGGTFSGAAILLIVVGVVIFIIGFFGCCGAYKENYCMTMTFAALLGIIFVLEIAAGIAAYVMRHQAEDFITKELNKNLPKYESDEGVMKAWDLAQKDFKCCGVNNYTDWSGKLNKTNDVPDSCCKTITKNCGAGQAKNPTKIYTAPCVTAFKDWVLKNIYIIGGVGIGLAFVQVVGIILACCLARTIKKEYEVV